MKKYMWPSLLFIMGLSLGVGGTNYYNKHQAQGHNLQLMEDIPEAVSDRSMDDFYDDFFDDDFFKENQFPFKQMEKMKDNMGKLFKGSQDGFPSNDIFDEWYKNKFGGRVGDVKQEEDKDSIYYKVHLPDIDKENVKVEVRDGIVNVSAKTEKSEEIERKGTVAKSSFKQTFERRFPVPSNANEEKVDYKFDGDYLVIQFPKINKGKGGSYDV